MTEQTDGWRLRDVVLILLVVIAFFLQQMWAKQDRNSRRITQIEIRMAGEYVPKDDFEKRLNRLEEKQNYAPKGGYK